MTATSTPTLRSVNVDQIERRIYHRGIWVGIVIGMPTGACLTAITFAVLKSLTG